LQFKIPNDTVQIRLQGQSKSKFSEKQKHENLSEKLSKILRLFRTNKAVTWTQSFWQTLHLATANWSSMYGSNSATVRADK